MIHELLNLTPAHAIGVATQLLTGCRSSVNDDVTPALSAAEKLPRTWQREWALTVLRTHAKSAAVRSLIAGAKRAKLSTSTEVWAEVADPRTGTLTLSTLSFMLVGKTFTLKLKLSGDKNMTIDNEAHNKFNLPVQLHLGELTVSVEDVLALKRGETLRCPLPDELIGTLHSLGASIGSAKITFVDGKITLAISQLFSSATDNNSSLF